MNVNACNAIIIFSGVWMINVAIFLDLIIGAKSSVYSICTGEGERKC